MAGVHALALDAAGPRVGWCPLTVVASRNAQSASSLAAPRDARVATIDHLPDGAEIVIVATPPGQHLVPALRAAAGGAAVVVEKPLCTTLADADRLVRVAEAGAMVTYAENLLFAPAFDVARREIATLGALGHISAHVAQPAPTWGNFLTRDAGGGVLLDLGVHALALVLRLAGDDEPVAVRATFEMPADAEVEHAAEVTVDFASGLSARIDVAWRDVAASWNLQAASGRGAVYLELVPLVQVERDGEPVPVPPVPDGQAAPHLVELGYVDQICEVVYAHRAERSVAASSVHLGRRVLEIVCAAATSAAGGGERVALPFLGPRDRTPIELFAPPGPELRSRTD